MKKTVKVHISGLVQGVFFRDFIKKSADRLAVKGFVRNIEDGRVEVVIEGEVDNVNAMTEICRRGSPHSHVKRIDIKDEKFQNFTQFKILHI